MKIISRLFFIRKRLYYTFLFLLLANILIFLKRAGIGKNVRYHYPIRILIFETTPEPIQISKLEYLSCPTSKHFTIIKSNKVQNFDVVILHHRELPLFLKSYMFDNITKLMLLYTLVNLFSNRTRQNRRHFPAKYKTCMNYSSSGYHLITEKVISQ